MQGLQETNNTLPAVNVPLLPLYSDHGDENDVAGAQTVAEDTGEASGAQRNSINGAQRPPFYVAVTGYRLLNTGLIVGIGSAKAILVARGKSAAPSVLEWILGVILTVV